MAPTGAVSTKNGMFHTFQGIALRKASSDSSGSSKSRANGGSKRITTPHACAECKRRKIRCDGRQPCGQCLSSRAPKRCFYDKHRQRVIPSRKTLEALSQSLEECRSVLRKLYPRQEISGLLPLSREELLALLDKPMIDPTLTLPSPSLNASPPKSEIDILSALDSEGGLADFEQMPSGTSEWDEERQSTYSIPLEADDVNALSLPLDRQTSYLGASSIKAALMVMLQLQPQLKNSMAPPLNSVEMASNLPIIQQRSFLPKDLSRIPWSWKGQTLIDAYFKRIHVFAPMLDEAGFRADYLEGQRFDAPWLALLNVVFAMGSIVAMKSDDFNHINYYNAAMEHLTIDALGSSHIETVQALTIIGGYYLHYINRPNMANAVTGAAIRMASALGLHRESLVHDGNDGALAETRRRTWWSLFCLDTWATTTLGRPSFGRSGAAINVQPPDFGMKSRDTAQHAGILPLIENIKFCKIATQIQEMLAVTPLLRAKDRHCMDAQLVNWFDGLPWLLRTSEPCAEPLYIARCVMKWRYQNLRMLIHRPVLLSKASSGLAVLTEKDAQAVETCRDIARCTIDDIAREWSRNQMSGWNAVWFLYQAAMIPLVSIFWQWNSPQVPEWQAQIQKILEMLDSMEDWSLAARRSREVVWRMYEASRQLPLVQPEDPIEGIHVGQALMLSEIDLHMSPIELDSGDMAGVFDQYGLWDSGVMDWGGIQGSMQGEDSVYNFDEESMQMDYLAVGV